MSSSLAFKVSTLTSTLFGTWAPRRRSARPDVSFPGAAAAAIALAADFFRPCLAGRREVAPASRADGLWSGVVGRCEATSTSRADGLRPSIVGRCEAASGSRANGLRPSVVGSRNVALAARADGLRASLVGRRTILTVGTLRPGGRVVWTILDIGREEDVCVATAGFRLDWTRVINGRARRVGASIGA